MSNPNLSVGLQGEFRVVVLRNNTIQYESDWFSNLILDSGLDYLGFEAIDPPIAAKYCSVGTNGAAPNVSQSGLLNPLGSPIEYSTENIVNLGVTEDYATLITLQYNFSQGGIIGTVREAGVGWDSTSLFSRVLFPTAITLTSIDQLIMFYRIRLEPTITDTTGSLVIGGTSYDFTSRVALVADFGGGSTNALKPTNFSKITSALAYDDTSSLGPITGNLIASTGGNPADSYVYQTYVPGSFTKTTTVTYMPSTANYIGGVLGFTLNSGSYYWQMVLNNPVPKTDQDLFTITFRIGWNRA